MTAAPGTNLPTLKYAPKATGVADSVAMGPVVETIGRFVGNETKSKFKEAVRAIVLTGSLARNEGTIRTNEEGAYRVLGDAEFLIMLAPGHPYPLEREIEGLARHIEAVLLTAGIDCPISLAFVYENFFRSMTPHMFAYETRVSGSVVDGECDPLSMIPPFSISDIPREDGWRTLTNRMLELAEAMAAKIPTQARRVPEEIAYRAMKLTLDSATSLLLFTGGYAPSYSQRAVNFSQIASGNNAFPELGIRLMDLAHELTLCTQWKLSGEKPKDLVTWNWIRINCERAIVIWRWELMQLSGMDLKGGNAKIHELIRHAADAQPFSKRIRGWLYVVRREGWMRSLRFWPKWLSMSLKATPRYWIYESTAHAFLRVEEYLTPNCVFYLDSVGGQRLKSDLPLWPSGEKKDSLEWREFVRAIAWNYHRYLEGTRA